MNELLESVTFCGRLGKTPELRYSKNKKVPMCFLDVAENKEGEEEAQWHRVVVWGAQAEYCNTHLKTGEQFFIHGRKNRRKFIDKDGNERTAQEIKAQHIGFIRQ